MVHLVQWVIGTHGSFGSDDDCTHGSSGFAYPQDTWFIWFAYPQDMWFTWFSGSLGHVVYLVLCTLGHFVHVVQWMTGHVVHLAQWITGIHGSSSFVYPQGNWFIWFSGSDNCREGKCQLSLKLTLIICYHRIGCTIIDNS